MIKQIHVAMKAMPWYTFLPTVSEYMIEREFAKMFSAQNKIHKDKSVAPTDSEQEVAQAFFDLENTNQELKSDLKDLYINQAV
ncbi:unnamed protein product, partial [Eruca vesicaria subsp. sativa]|nr:unnamed protein product [Eruca vesicaria subsp. sativa]